MSRLVLCVASSYHGIQVREVVRELRRTSRPSLGYDMSISPTSHTVSHEVACVLRYILRPLAVRLFRL